MKEIKSKPRLNSRQLVKMMITQLSLHLTSEKRFTQEYAANLIGCHRHWIRKHQERYNIDTGEPDQNGLTPQEILDLFERERTKEKVHSPLEIALQNADAMVNRQKLTIKALEEQLEAQRKLLHLISLNKDRLGISDQELFREPID